MGVWYSNTNWLGSPWDHRQMKLWGVLHSPALRRCIWRSATVRVLWGPGAGKEGGLPRRGAQLTLPPAARELGSPFQVKERKRTSTWVPPRHVPLTLACHSQPEQGPHHPFTDENAEAQGSHHPHPPSFPQNLQNEEGSRGSPNLARGPAQGQKHQSSMAGIPPPTQLLGTANGMMQPEARATELFGGARPWSLQCR